MNRLALLCLPWLLPSTLIAQQVVQFERLGLVRTAPDEVTLNPSLLDALAGSADAHKAVARVLGKQLGDPNQCTVQVSGLTAPQPPGVCQFSLVITGTFTGVLDAATQDAAARGVIEVLRTRLEALLGEGPRRDLGQRAEELDERLRGAEAEREALAARLLELGGEDPVAAQKWLGESHRRRQELELDLRTEEALQSRLQKLVDEARRKLADAGEQAAAITDEASRLGAELTEQRKRLELAPDAATLQALQKELAQSDARSQRLQRQRATAIAAADAQERLLQELAAQATASTLAFHRHAARLEVLRAAVAEQEKRVAEAVLRAAERAKAEQQVRRWDDTLALLRARRNELAQRLESRQPIRVELWR